MNNNSTKPLTLQLLHDYIVTNFPTATYQKTRAFLLRTKKKYNDLFFNSFMDLFVDIYMEFNESPKDPVVKIDKLTQSGMKNEVSIVENEVSDIKNEVSEDKVTESEVSVTVSEVSDIKNEVSVDKVTVSEVSVQDPNNYHKFLIQHHQQIVNISGPNLFKLYRAFCVSNGLPIITTRQFTKTFKPYTGETTQKWVDKQVRTVYSIKPHIYAKYHAIANGLLS